LWKTTVKLEDKILEFSKTHNVVSVAFYNKSDELDKYNAWENEAYEVNEVKEWY